MSLFRSMATIGGFTAISRVLGLVREILIARFLGASLITDAFFVAFKFPNFFRRIFAEGAFSAAFIPLFSQELMDHGPEKAKAFSQKAFSMLALVVGAIVLCVVAFTPLMVSILAPGFATTPERFELAVTFTRITFPYILFMSLTAHLSGVLNSLDRFGKAAATPIFLNITMIIALLIVFFCQGKNYGMALCMGVFVAGMIQFAFVYHACWILGFAPRLGFPSWSQDMKTLGRLMIPGILGGGAMNVSLFLDTFLASFLAEKSVSFLFYADRLNQFPLSILGIGMGVALLPSLSRDLKAGQEEKARQTKGKTLEVAVALTLPATIGLVVLSYPLIHLIYHLPASDSWATSQALSAFALGIPAYVMTKILLTGFFARQDTKTPVKVGVAGISLNFALNLLLMPFWGHVGLALATSVSAWAQTLLLFSILRKRHWFHLSLRFWGQMGRAALASLAMAGFLMPYLGKSLSFWGLLGAVNLGAGIYITVGGWVGLFSFGQLAEGGSRLLRSLVSSPVASSPSLQMKGPLQSKETPSSKN